MNYIQDRPIGVFDSGIGGLTVAAELMRLLPGEDLIYLGDTARVPYGTKSPRTVRRYSLECALYLLSRDVKLIVVACNTASAVALPFLQSLLQVPLIGVVDPGVQTALRATRNGRIGVIGTPSTIRSGAYQRRLKEERPTAEVWGRACPLFVPLVEEGRLEGKINALIIDEYLHPLKRRAIDTLILGCTHYPLLKTAISEYMGNGVSLVDSATAAAVEVRDVLLRKSLLRTHSGGDFKCLVTDVSHRFHKTGSRFLGKPMPRIQQVNLEELG